MKDLIIIGAGALGRETAWLSERINAVSPSWNLLGFLDDNPKIQGGSVHGYPVLGDIGAAKGFHDARFVCAIGAARVRRRIVAWLDAMMTPAYATLMDPTVILSARVSIGDGCVLIAGSVITVDIEIGKHVVVHMNCTIGHDAVLHDYVTMYPSVNVSGAVNIGEAAELGTGVQIIQGKTIGAETIVGAGAVVVRDLPAKCTAVGNPARPIKYHE